MKKRIITILLAALMLASLLPMTALAEEPATIVFTPKAPAEAVARIGETTYPTLAEAIAAADPMDARDVVLLLTDVIADDITIPYGVFLDLNHHLFEASGKITNDGCIILYQENADIVSSLLLDVPGDYGAGEEIRLPDGAGSIPAGTFFSSDVTDEGPELGFALGEEPLVWNSDVPDGTLLHAVYAVTLGGNVPAAKVRANKVSLSSDIIVGSSTEDGEAVLFVESLYDDLFGDDIGSFSANGKKITLNENGKVVLSADIAFDDSVLVCGVEGKVIRKLEDKEAGTVTYFVGSESGDGLTADNRILNFCVDVKTSDYYHDAVLWAYLNDICTGVDNVHFGPDKPVTRAQVVTFLWRAAGCPVVNYAMDMNDVEADEYYTEAVRWALSKGITKGTDENTFSPNKVCTRAQIVTFLARFAGVEDSETESTFSDVSATDYFAAAVSWAKDNKVTEGKTPTLFCPNDSCTRAQTVTFLWRWIVK